MASVLQMKFILYKNHISIDKQGSSIPKGLITNSTVLGPGRVWWRIGGMPLFEQIIV